MKCSVIGGSVIREDFSEIDFESFNEIGKWLAEQDIKVLTGACGGVPHLIGKSCLAHGGEVYGYSPANSLDEHINKFSHPIDGCSEIKFLKSDSENMNMRFLLRSIPLLEEADVVICLEGNWGTLFEIVTGIICGKTIIFFNGFGGVTDNMDVLYEKLSNECRYNYGENIYFVSSIKELENIVLKVGDEFGKAVD